MLTYDIVILRLLLAVTLGGIIGLDRERLEWVAGLRTHMLVCLGAAVAMIVSAFGFDDILGRQNVTLDPSRIAAQVISGVSFLGAGTILFLHKEIIRGLTTAASLWTVAAIGLAVGGGLYVVALSATLLVFVILALIKPLERKLFGGKRGSRQVLIRADGQRLSLPQLEAALAAANLEVADVSLKRGEPPEGDEIRLTLQQPLAKHALLTVAGRLRELDGVREVSF